MRIIFCIIFLTQFICSAQTKVNSLLDKVVSDIVPEKYNFFFLVQESLSEKKAFDSLKIESPNDFIFRFNPDLPKDLLNEVENKSVSWRDYNLNKVKYITKEMTKKFVCNNYDLYFVNAKISIDSLDLLNKNKEVKTLLVRKSKKWSKKRMWEEIYKVWNEHKLKEEEQKKCYNFSYPIFSKDEKYARISVSEYTIGGESCNSYIYKYENDNWKLIAEFHNYGRGVYRTHVGCDELSVIFMN